MKRSIICILLFTTVTVQGMQFQRALQCSSMKKMPVSKTFVSPKFRLTFESTFQSMMREHDGLLLPAHARTFSNNKKSSPANIIIPDSWKFGNEHDYERMKSFVVAWNHHKGRCDLYSVEVFAQVLSTFLNRTMPATIPEYVQMMTTVDLATLTADLRASMVPVVSRLVLENWMTEQQREELFVHIVALPLSFEGWKMAFADLYDVYPEDTLVRFATKLFYSQDSWTNKKEDHEIILNLLIKICGYSKTRGIDLIQQYYNYYFQSRHIDLGLLHTIATFIHKDDSFYAFFQGTALDPQAISKFILM